MPRHLQVFYKLVAIVRISFVRNTAVMRAFRVTNIVYDRAHKWKTDLSYPKTQGQPVRAADVFPLVYIVNASS